MSRIRKAYEARFLWLLQHVRARQTQKGLDILLQRACQTSAAQRTPLADGLRQVHQQLSSRKPFAGASLLPVPTRFWCDAGLGGLARWLRATGWEAEWEPGIDDTVLVNRARESGATIITTDSMLMERRLIRERTVPALWLPPTLSLTQQLETAFRELRLKQKQPSLCMSCGGPLERRQKEQVRERIPPRTLRWLSDYFVCTRCGKLFWHGTHWQKIQRRLAALGQLPED
jgi:uncharacterized protein